MIIVPEKEIAGLMGRAEAFSAVEAVFASMSRGDAYNFPVIREALGEGRQYGFKSGLDRKGGVMGVKAGGYFPGNADRGIPNHQSTVYLFDPESGKPTAMVGGNLLTALRTAAASSVSIKYLSREDSKVLGMVGAGHQSTFQLRAAVEQRSFEKVVAWNPHPEMLPNLAKVADELGLPFEAVEREELGAQADVIITITSAFEPLMMKDWIKPGTHIACMGTDTKGKQEVDAALVAAANVFTDEIAQSVTIGECQHAIAQGLIAEADIGEIGAVINGTIPGRQGDDEITLFDGTGVGLQDLAVAAAVVDLAVEKGIAIEVDF
ncbi:MAG: ornithine cyclodeaminase family protein [Paracoccaceae bacterium]|nr:ornithine cyclodeaminase family protein [Paracoccaceae bacterium]